MFLLLLSVQLMFYVVFLFFMQACPVYSICFIALFNVALSCSQLFIVLGITLFYHDEQYN